MFVRMPELLLSRLHRFLKICEICGLCCTPPSICRKKLFRLVFTLSLVLSACSTGSGPGGPFATVAVQPSPVPELVVTPFPTRPPYAPGELVDYIAQTGDTLLTLAVRFNTSVAEIRTANPFIPAETTTMPPGMPMKIPIYYAPFWGSPYQIIPDGLFVNGPAQVGFSTSDFVAMFPGWLNQYSEYGSGANRTGAQVVDLVAQNYSVSPRLLLALLEYQAGALSNPQLPKNKSEYHLGITQGDYQGMYLQLVWAANFLNNNYYAWRNGSLQTFDLQNSRTERPDPWQNAATVALQTYFAKLSSAEAYAFAISPQGLAAVYQQLFGDPWANPQPHLPGSLQQPNLDFPFLPGRIWAYTGGPHTGWGTGEPLAAIDFAPAAAESGCAVSPEWATAMAGGVVVRSETGIVVLDLDGDGDERTGWVLFYLHLATDGRAAVGQVVKAGDPVGHPSCEGGHSTGTHVHIARKYNGEWILAGGMLPFRFAGWRVENGAEEYQGYLVYGSTRLRACTCADNKSQIQAQGTFP